MIELIMAMQIATARIEVPQRFRGDNIVLTQFTDQVTIAKWCKEPRAVGCHVKTPEGFEMIVVLNPCRLNSRDPIIMSYCHELGHVNGWGRDHGK